MGSRCILESPKVLVAIVVIGTRILHYQVPLESTGSCHQAIDNKIQCVWHTNELYRLGELWRTVFECTWPRSEQSSQWAVDNYVEWISPRSKLYKLKHPHWTVENNVECLWQRGIFTAKTSDRIGIAMMRQVDMSANAAIDPKTKQGLEYVCTCCHRIMYHKCVVYCNRSKYLKTCKSVEHSVFSDALLYNSPDYSYYVFNTWNTALFSSRMPLQAEANNLGPSTVPPELKCLNSLETRLVVYECFSWPT